MYDVLAIDPPWPHTLAKNLHNKRQKNGARTEWAYPTMPTPDIFNLLDRDIFPLASPRHTVFMWCIDRALNEAEAAMYGRGYKRHARFVWDKMSGFAPAFTVRYTHEYLLWFCKGGLVPIAKDMRGKLSTVIRDGSKRQHSEKPQGFYTMMEKLYPDARRLEVFSRHTRPGWTAWGNQIGVLDAAYSDAR